MHFQLDFLPSLLEQAGNMILEAHDSCDESAITVKAGSANFVTVHDVRVQDFLMTEIKKQIPEVRFIAEEQENDAAVLQSDCCFVIDPIDGTTNFIHNYRHSCISVAVFSKGEPIFGAVYDPYLKEYFHAKKGQGAFIGDKPIRVSEFTLEQAVVAYGTAPYYRDELGDATFALTKELFLASADIRRCGSAALDLAYLAAGRNDAFFELRLSPWDFAAGYLLITEAGGIISSMNGMPLDFSKPQAVIAANKIAYPALLEIAKQYA
jgi:myo-inositol-1(or 4)-monophosphatase